MLQKYRLILLQFRGRFWGYFIANTISIILLTFQMLLNYVNKHIGVFIDSDKIKMIYISLILLFSGFMIIPYVSELYISEFQEVAAGYESKMRFLFIFQNGIYYIHILIWLFFEKKIFGIYICVINTLLLCFLFQMIIYVILILSKSSIGTVGIGIVYLMFSLFFKFENSDSFLGLFYRFETDKTLSLPIAVKCVVVLVFFIFTFLNRRYLNHQVEEN